MELREDAYREWYTGTLVQLVLARPGRSQLVPTGPDWSRHFPDGPGCCRGETRSFPLFTSWCYNYCVFFFTSCSVSRQDLIYPSSCP